MDTRGGRVKRHTPSPLVGALGALAVAAVIAACGGGNDDGTGAGATPGVTTAGPEPAATADTEATTSETEAGTTAGADALETTYAEYSGPVTWPGPDEPVAPPAGKKITIVICGSQGITCVRVGEGAKEAAETLGWEATVVDGRSQPTVWNQAIRSAVASDTDGIILAAVPPGLAGDAVQAASQAGIPIVATLSVGELGNGVVANVQEDRIGHAAANAAFVAKDSGGDAKILLVRDDEFPEIKLTSDAYPMFLEEFCPDCEIVDEVDFTLALASQRLAGNVAQALQSNPEIDYIVLPFDTINTFVIQGVRQAGKAGQVSIVGLGGDPVSVEAIAAGDQTASLGTPAEWIGWNAVDALARTFADAPVPPLDEEVNTNYQVPSRYVTAENLPGPEGWQGDFDYQVNFRELWGK